MARTTILEYLDNFQRHAREVAYVYHRSYRVQRWTYGEVLANAHRFGRELNAREIAKGDKVLIWGENCAEWVVAFFGCLLRGVIVVPIDKIAAPDFAQRVAQEVDAKLCVCSSENTHKVWHPLLGLRAGQSPERRSCQSEQQSRRAAGIRRTPPPTQRSSRPR